MEEKRLVQYSICFNLTVFTFLLCTDVYILWFLHDQIKGNDFVITMVLKYLGD